MATPTSQELVLQAEILRLRERIANLEQRRPAEERQAGEADPRSLPPVGMPAEWNVARHTGITIVGDVPWGTHSCCFYQDKQDLIVYLKLL